jgi:hypothetical protein
LNWWQWLGRKFPRNPRGPRAHTFLVGAYRRVLVSGGTSTDEDKQIVLADLANASGFYRVSGPGLTAEDRAFADGMRSVYARVHVFLRMTDQEIRNLEEAARQEAIIDSEPGDQ